MWSPLTCSILPSRQLSPTLPPFTLRSFLYSSYPIGGLSWPSWKTVLSLILCAFFLLCDIFGKSSKSLSISISSSLRLGIGLYCLWPFRHNISGYSRTELSTRSSSMTLYQFGIAKISDFYPALTTAYLMTFFLNSIII